MVEALSEEDGEGEGGTRHGEAIVAVVVEE